MYGRRLIQTEKVDAVFGNPERAKGGTHWVIVGSAAILLVWLYYSWDIAKGFYPKSANELCQVAKINESLLGLKYQFPIEEREFKSTSIIKIENKNLQKITAEIQNSNDLNSQQKTILVGYINKTKKLTYKIKEYYYSKFSNVRKFNLDYETFFLEFKDKLLSE